MNSYAKLPVPAQALVDALVGQIVDLDWPERRRITMTTALKVLAKTAESGTHFPQTPILAAASVIAATIERLGDKPVGDRDQGMLYGLSLDRTHILAAEAWFADHPGERAQLESENAVKH